MASSPPLSPGARVGILGGGQLGRMLALAAARLGFDVHVLCPEADCPASRVAARFVQADYSDLAALESFCRSVDAITFEFENIPEACLGLTAALLPTRPGRRSLSLTQDRWIEKRFIQSLGLKTAPVELVSSRQELSQAAKQIGGPGILKTRRFGYDGKGQTRVTNADEDSLSFAWAEMAEQPCVLEGLVPFQCEVSVVLARGEDGQTACFDVVRNRHAQGMLQVSHVPSGLTPDLESQAIHATQRIAHALDHVGVLATEFFVTEAEAGQPRLIVNEIAPRVHNSGHWTEDACQTSQFEQHIRAVAGWPLGSPTRHHNVEMYNLIGEAAHDWARLAADPAVKLHLYGKRSAREGRKMGHTNRLSPL
jgi:5-(carboxyamino)imidazole ribonucleotide synthase